MIKKLTSVLFAVLIFSQLYGQTFMPPTLPQNGKAVTDFVPSRWSIIDSISGDLNNDGLPDFAMVIQSEDTFHELRPNNMDLRSNPRILAVLLKTKSSYELAVQNNTFIFRYEEVGMFPESLGELKIDSGMLYIDFYLTRAGYNYKFKYQSKTLCLVWAAEGDIGPNTYDGWELDFLKGQANHRWGEIEDDSHPQNEWKKIPVNPLKKLSDMRMAGEWEVLPGVFI